MTDPEALAELVAEGCAIRDCRFWFWALVSDAEIVNGKIFWVYQFAETDFHAHAIRFTASRQWDHGLVFYRGKRRVAYVGPYWKFRDIPQEEALRERRRWLNYLSVAKNRLRWKKFVQHCRWIHTGPESG